jgi:hypothetical protein
MNFFLKGVLTLVTGAETTQTQRGSLPEPGAITASFAEHESAGLLDQADVRLLVDFFLLLEEWDTLSTRT